MLVGMTARYLPFQPAHLIVLFMIFGSLAQYGINPHLKASKLRCLVLNWIASTSCVGAMFQLIGRSRCGGIGI